MHCKAAVIFKGQNSIMNCHQFANEGQNSLYCVVQSLRTGVTCQEYKQINCLSGGFMDIFFLLRLGLPTPLIPIFNIYYTFCCLWGDSSFRMLRLHQWVNVSGYDLHWRSSRTESFTERFCETLYIFTLAHHATCSPASERNLGFSVWFVGT